MSELLWVCEEGSVFSSELNGMRLLVARSPMGGGYRYQLLRPVATSGEQVSLASGYKQDLRDAISAAERAARGFSRPSARPEPLLS
jgi:hypothetical protein